MVTVAGMDDNRQREPADTYPPGGPAPVKEVERQVEEDDSEQEREQPAPMIDSIGKRKCEEPWVVPDANEQGLGDADQTVKERERADDDDWPALSRAGDSTRRCQFGLCNSGVHRRVKSSRTGWL